MSNKALNWAEKIPLPRGEKTFLLILANKFNEKDGYCHPKIKTLAHWCSCSERSIKRYIKSLISKNIIQTEEFRNQLGHRICLKYHLNFEQDLNSLSDNMSPRDLKALVTRCPSLSDTVSKPKCHGVTKDYIYKPNIKPKEKQDFSLGDNFNEQKQQTIIGIKFEQLRKIYDDNYDIENARRLFFSICLENDHPTQFAYNLIKARKCQIIEFEKQTRYGKLMPTPCSLTNWLKGKRWNDIIKPLGDKKKVSPYVKCKCGEEYLKGTNCRRCEELTKSRLVYA